MKTIIQVVQHLHPGGIEIIALDLLDFSQEDERMIIISLEGTLKSAVKHWPKLKAYQDHIIFLDKQPGITPSLVTKLKNIFINSAANAIHTHHIGPLLYAGLAARLCSIKQLTHTEHDAWHLNNKKRCFIQRMAIKLLTPTLVADAQAVADNMQAKLQCDNKITVIRNGINSQYFKPGNQVSARETLNLPTDVQIIGCSGRMEKVKGQSVLINALLLLDEGVHIAFAGSGSTEKSLRELVNILNLTDRVHFLGHIDKMPTFYQALDLFCLPSLNEGLPLSPLEAQACNIKTLVTDVGASRETLCPESGKYVVANNSIEMANKLIMMLNSPITCQPRAFVQQQGDVKKMAKSYSNLRNTIGLGACYE
ncbi:MAG: glycosyltransferase [Psychromonas sp.]|nr:glycosyltransferase [Psychromonas sp.]